MRKRRQRRGSFGTTYSEEPEVGGRVDGRMGLERRSMRLQVVLHLEAAPDALSQPAPSDTCVRFV